MNVLPSRSPDVTAKQRTVLTTLVYDNFGWDVMVL